MTRTVQPGPWARRIQKDRLPRAAGCGLRGLGKGSFEQLEANRQSGKQDVEAAQRPTRTWRVAGGGCFRRRWEGEASLLGA